MDILYEGEVVWPRGASERTGPSAGSPSVNTLPVNTAVQGVDLHIEQAGSKEWMQLVNGNWVATIYPDSTGAPKTRVEYHEISTPPPTDVVITSVIVNYTVNGQQFSKTFTQ
ncbi:MAG: hypothetical protein ACOYZ8_13310 [Chloroflexota bacterium]